MKDDALATVGQRLYWAYANLGMAHAALSKRRVEYVRMDYIIRHKLYSGLLDGTMNLGSLKDDERLKLQLPQVCCYCGNDTKLTLDHLIPTLKGGSHAADNIVWACQPCNSSKGAVDLVEWHQKAGRFPPLLLLRRYLKIAINHCIENGYMGLGIEDCVPLPFSLQAIPVEFPKLSDLCLWIVPLGPGSGATAN